MNNGKMRRHTLKSIFLYCIYIWLLAVGYFLGVLHSFHRCNENTSILNPSVTSDSTELLIQKHAAFFVVVIFSAPANYERRLAIRKTWLSTKGNLSIKHFFAIGTASLDSHQKEVLLKEHTEYDDLLILDSVSDSFSKLSGKLRAIFRWLDKHVDFTFLLKVDDDSFVRLNALYSESIKQPHERLYWGFFDGQARVKTKGKWKEHTWFLCDRYLPYAKGGGYLLTSDLVHIIVINSNYLSLYQNEDVALGTWLAPFDIKRLHDHRFDTEFMSRGCFNTYFVTHKQSTSMMIAKFNNFIQTGNLCQTEYRDRNSYHYNWNVLPSLCCIRNNSHIP
ncbi:beta-1,3-galactosyltransferase 6 [Trichonephila inaurata madagascariensis]|uniref:Hexosyltransferase n=1 Tax=Trichonephila inaurata madagascariensis TaxID=2747483 RepID=A0A8X6YCK5_9ARAC|nr:beta-1,3-galactosyltransferase 6 [Trichonephila inaurata madagascariensis]